MGSERPRCIIVPNVHVVKISQSIFICQDDGCMPSGIFKIAQLYWLVRFRELHVIYIIMENFVKIGQSVAEISRFLNMATCRHLGLVWRLFGPPMKHT